MLTYGLEVIKLTNVANREVQMMATIGQVLNRLYSGRDISSDLATDLGTVRTGGREMVRAYLVYYLEACKLSHEQL